jgi:phenylalanyl-tRNA synthetase beta chain
VAGSTEVYNYSFYGTQLVDRAGSGVTDDHIEILNPLSEDLQFLRVSLLPRLLETVEKNSAHTKQLQLFEIGHVYFADREVHQLGIVKTGTADSYRELRGIMEDVFTQHGIHPTAARVGRVGDCAYWNWYAGGEALEWTVGDVVLGTIGILDSTIAKQFHIDGPLAFALISIPSLLAVAEQITEFQPTSPYPSIALDLSVIVPESVRWAEVESVIRDSQQSIDWLRSLQVTDIYRGDSIPVGHKSLTFHCILQSDSETLEMPVIEAWRDAWVKHLEKSCGAVLRDR